MGTRSNLVAELPSLVLYIATTVLLALVSFNTPILKSLYFLQATYTDGAIKGRGTFGTLGYCYDYDFNSNEASRGGQKCSNVQLGYELGGFKPYGECLELGKIALLTSPKLYTIDLNNMFGIDSINIPTAVSKYLTYVLVLHIVGE